MEMSRTGSGLLPWEEQFICGKTPNFLVMNWTDGKLYQSKRGKLRKTNEDRRRQKEYFAKADERRAKQKELDGKPPEYYVDIVRAAQLGPYSGNNTEQSRKRPRDDSIYKNLPRTADELLKELEATRVGANVPQPGPQKASEEPEKEPERKIQKPLEVTTRISNGLLPRRVFKKRRLRETKITDFEAFKKERRETLSHIIQGRQELRRIQYGRRDPPQKQQDVRIRIGSQEKRLGGSSILTEPTQPLPPPPIRPPTDTVAQRRAPVSLRKSSSYDSESVVVSRRKRPKHRRSSTPKIPEQPKVRSLPLRKSPVIYAPAPRRFVHKDILLSETWNSQDTDSVLAQVAHAPPPVPSSQRSENNIWRNWMESVGSATQTDRAVEGSLGSIHWPPVSPGVSEPIKVTRGQAHSLPDVQDSPTPGPDSPIQNGDQVFDELISTDSSLILNWDHEVSKELPKPAVAIEHHREVFTGDSNRQVPGIPKKWTGNIPTIAFKVPDSDPESPTEDPEVAWKAFIFRGAESDDIEQAALEDEKRDVAQVVRPPDSSPSDKDPDSSSADSEPDMFERESNIATVGTTAYTNHDLSSEPDDGSEPEVTDENPTVYKDPKSTLGSSSLQEVQESESILESSSLQEFQETISNSESDILDSVTQTPTVDFQVSSSIDPDMEISSTDNMTSGLVVSTESVSSSLPEVDISSTNNMTSDLDVSTENVPSSVYEAPTNSVTSDMASMAVELPRSEIWAGKPKDNFRFAPPRLFVGSRSIESQPSRPRPVEPLSVVARRGRGRQRKRARDGRANIRALPNYTSDPIEEIEDDDMHDSRFGALELE